MSQQFTRVVESRRVRALAGASFLLVGFAVGNWPTHAQAQSAYPSTDVRAVPTYESVGLYWTNSGANAAGGCEVQFRKAGASAFTKGLAMWFDARNSECRGSLVHLAPGTMYEAQLNLPGAGVVRAITFTTWSNQPPVASTVRVPSGSATLDITQGGSPSGYVVYDGTGSTLDAGNGAPTNISINASYVIVRGFTLKGAQQHGILIDKMQHDVVIEDNDISGWGRTRDGTWGTDMDSGIRAVCQNEELTRVTIQRNRIHDPRYSANSWAVAHPAGPQGITFSYCGGNNVYRWNEIYSSANHFNDGMGGEDNFSTAGFPNKDSDLYGNRVEMAWDDGMEIEGGDQNVRVWGNYLDNTGTGIASTIDSVGPLYIFRNVWNRNQFIEGVPHDQDQRQPMFKDGSSADFGNGRRYLFHNTMLQASDGVSQYGLGGGAGVGGTGDTQLVHNTISMNNIYHLWKPNSMVYQVGSDNTFQNDMYNGSAGTAIVSGFNATPTYAPGNGWRSESTGLYALAAGTAGFDQGVRIPNFNDDFVGAGPDVGAAEAGAPAMAFGLIAGIATATGTSNPTPTPTPTPTPSPTPTPPPAPAVGGTLSVSTTVDSTSYTASAGQGVTFTVNVMGTSGAPTGSVTFRDNGAAIAGCAGVAIAGGTAHCTTAALATGAHAITGLYSGDGTYGSGVAGPITQTINGSSAQSAASAVNAQGLWWRSSTGSESGWGINFTQQGETLFATWFTYDTDGSGLWLVMPNGAKTGTDTYTGTLYRTTGPAFDAASFNSTLVKTTAVGTATFSFSDANNGTFTALVNGNAVTKPITRQVYGASVPTCRVGASASPSNYQDLWWQSSGSESGWGMNITDQADILFVTWFTYGADGKGMWLVASHVARNANGTYSGTLYRTTGPAYNAPQWDPSLVRATEVGAITFAFSDASNATFTATVDGASVSKSIAREVFAPPPSACS
ncbi:MAG: Ig-like domain repeat protein [Usitatibacter sp.]